MEDTAGAGINCLCCGLESLTRELSSRSGIPDRRWGLSGNFGEANGINLLGKEFRSREHGWWEEKEG